MTRYFWRGLAIALAAALLAACGTPTGSAGKDIPTASDQTDVSRRANTRLELAGAYFTSGQYATALDEVKQVIALRELIAEAVEGGHKVLVFSQFVMMLKLIEKAMKEDGVPYEYLDGATKDRQERVERFQNDPTVPVFLISLKAGGTGLNLTAADTVVHFDPWWNPAVEQQATDRAHRIGQTKVVTAYRLVAAGTIEEKILQLKAKKRELVASVLSEDQGGAKKLTKSDLEELFAVD